ncbi:MAG TPA: hypothetical protein VD886_05275 [Herpetosiphonaceae bacterium]|nr:hypothetical protein [Herpetosiphonaceae bacterium]
MFAKFTETISSKAGEHWAVVFLAPAFAFWVGCLLAWADIVGWDSAISPFTNRTDPAKVAAGFGGLLIVLASTSVVQSMTGTMLRLMEGHWPRWLYPFAALCTRGQAWRAHRLERLRLRLYNQAFKSLSPDDQGLYTQLMGSDSRPDDLTIQLIDKLSPYQRGAYAQADYALMFYPPRPDQIMPTRLGNILRSARLKPQSRYGLDTVVCWPRLWILLPQDARNELISARKNLDGHVQLFTWGLLFIAASQTISILGGAWVWWGLMVGLAVVCYAYLAALGAAVIYGDLLVTAFDLYRHLLYKALRFPLPKTTSEKGEGQRLTAYLFRGLLDTPQAFHPPQGE